MHRTTRSALACLLLMPVLLAAAPVRAQDAGDSSQLELVGKWGRGTCRAVACDGDRILRGNGSVLEIGALDTFGRLLVTDRITLPSPVEGIAVAGDLAYVASRDAGLRIVDLAAPGGPAELGHARVPDDVRDVAVAGGYAYVAAEEAGLRIVDVSDPAAPAEVGFVDTEGFAAKLAVAGDHVYLADGYGGYWNRANMRVVDVSDPTAPFETGAWELPGQSYVNAWCLDVVGDLVYVGYDQGIIMVVDVSDPAAPTWAGGFDEGLDNVYDLKVVGDHLYAAYSWVGLGVFDLTDPLQPLPLAELDTPGDATRIAVAGGRALVADLDGGLQVCDVTNPAAPVLAQACPTPGVSHDLCVDGPMVYVADETFGLRILDLRRRDLPHEVGGLELPGTAVTVDVMDGHAYVAAASGGLRVVDVGDPAAPVEVGAWDLGGSFESVLARDGLVYCTESSGPLRVFDASDPSQPVQIGGYAASFNVRHAALKGGYLLCAQRNSYNSLWVLDVSDPAAVGSVASHDLTGFSWDIEVLGNTAYLSAGGTGVHILDVSDPAAAVFLGTYDPSDGANGLLARGDYLYVAGGGRVWMVEVSDPRAPVWSGWYDVGGTSWEIAELDGDLVVADHDDGVLVLRNALTLPADAAGGPPAPARTVTCRPNPCNPATTVAFGVPEAGPVRVDILDARGRRVARLLDRTLAAGPAAVPWRGRDDDGGAVASGVYFARVRTRAGTAVGKVVLVR